MSLFQGVIYQFHPAIVINNPLDGKDHLIDLGVAGLIRQLWHRGLPTYHSCQGGWEPGPGGEYWTPAYLTCRERDLGQITQLVRDIWTPDFIHWELQGMINGRAVLRWGEGLCSLLRRH